MAVIQRRCLADGVVLAVSCGDVLQVVSCRWCLAGGVLLVVSRWEVSWDGDLSYILGFESTSSGAVTVNASDDAVK